MTAKEIIKIIEDLTALDVEITTNDDNTEATSTYNPDKISFHYFCVCNELETFFKELYLENNTLIIDRVLSLLYNGLESWNEIKEWNLGFNISFENEETKHLKTELTPEQLLQVADIKTYYIQGLIYQIEALTTTTKAKPIFKLSDKKGAKTDLIRILNALYEIRLIEKADGQVPTKKEFFKTMGEYLGVNLSDYHTNLSQSLQNQSLEVNLKVFNEMIEATKNAHYQTSTK